MTQRKAGANDGEGRFGFLDALTRIFHGTEQETPGPAQQAPASVASLDALQAEFESAVGEVQKRVASMRESASGPQIQRADETPADRKAIREARLEQIHRRIRGDIEQMHARLGSRLKGGDLDDVIAVLLELQEISAEGRDSHDLVPRARHAIAERLRKESGELSLERLRALLEQEQISWPDPTRYKPGAAQEEIDRSRRRRLAEARETYLSHDFGRMAQRAVGVVSGWGDDYPEPGTPLWEICVLEGVGSGIRGKLALEFLEVLRQNSEALLSRCEEIIGKEVVALREKLDSGVHSISDANRAVAGTLMAIDLVMPEVAWNLLVEKLPLARGDWND